MSKKKLKRNFIRYGKTPRRLGDDICKIILDAIIEKNDLVFNLFEHERIGDRHNKTHYMIDYIDSNHPGEEIYTKIRNSLKRKLDRIMENIPRLISVELEEKRMQSLRLSSHTAGFVMRRKAGGARNIMEIES